MWVSDASNLVEHEENIVHLESLTLEWFVFLPLCHYLAILQMEIIVIKKFPGNIRNTDDFSKKQHRLFHNHKVLTTSWMNPSLFLLKKKKVGDSLSLSCSNMSNHECHLNKIFCYPEMGKNTSHFFSPIHVISYPLKTNYFAPFRILFPITSFSIIIYLLATICKLWIFILESLRLQNWSCRQVRGWN